VTVKRDRTRIEDVPAARNNTRAQDGYDAYFGTFEVDEEAGLVKTHLVAALSRDHVGKTLARRMTVEVSTPSLRQSCKKASPPISSPTAVT